MPIPVICQHCQSKFRAPDAAIGRKTKCPKCDNSILITSSTPTTVAVKQAAPKPVAIKSIPPSAATNSDPLETEFQPDMSFFEEALIDSAAEKKVAQASTQSTLKPRSSAGTLSPVSSSTNTAASREGGFFEDGGTPLLAKMFLAAIVAPGICLALIAKKGNPKEFDKLMSSPSQAMFVIGGISAAAAFAAGILGCRDVVQQRLAQRKYVPLLFRLLFMNIITTIFVWVAMIIFLTLAGTMFYFCYLIKK